MRMQSPSWTITALALVSGIALGLLGETLAWRAITLPDVLTFSGAVLGAVATVVGSFAVLRWQMAQQERERLKFWLDAIDEPLRQLDQLKQKAQQGLQSESDGDWARTQVWYIEKSLRRLEKVVQIAPPTSLAMLQAAESLDGLAGEPLDDCKQSITASAQYGGSMHEPFDPVAEPLIAQLQTARRALIR